MPEVQHYLPLAGWAPESLLRSVAKNAGWEGLITKASNPDSKHQKIWGSPKKKNLKSDLQHSVQISLLSNATLTPLTPVNRVITDTSAILSEPSSSFHPVAQFPPTRDQHGVTNSFFPIFPVKQTSSRWKKARRSVMTRHVYSHRPGQKVILHFSLQPRGYRFPWQNLVNRTQPCSSCHFTSARFQFIRK